MNNLIKRLITGTLFVIAILGSILLHKYAYFVVFGTIVILGINELNKLLNTGQTSIQKEFTLIIGAILYLGTFFAIAENISPLWFLILIPVITLVFIIELFRKSEAPISNIALTLFVPFYIALPFSFLHFLAFYTGEYHFKFLLGFFILVWSNDTGAYLIGVNFGKKRLFERLSPKKSWEGAIGGTVITLLIAVGLSFFYPNFSMFHLINCIFIGVIISIMGIFGDLTGSLIKRSVNKKDSGTIFPGHGGIIDRFDSVVFAAPMVVGYLILVGILYNL